MNGGKCGRKKRFLHDYILQSYDTVLKEGTADYSAITTWGVFKPDEGPDNIVLLDASGRWNFPELKEKRTTNTNIGNQIWMN